jgi:hypothetical protein
MNITLPTELKERIEKKAFRMGISASRWLEKLAEAELSRKRSST